MPGTLTVAVAIGLIGVGGVVFGLVELTGMGIAALLLVAVAFGGVALRRPGLGCVRDVEPSRIFAGGQVRVHVMVSRHGRGHSPSVQLRDPIVHTDGTSGVATPRIRPLAPGETERVTYPLRVARRGTCILGPMTLRCEDPFGLAARLVAGAPPIRFTVLPAIETISPPVVRHDADTLTNASPFASGSEFASLRAYIPGDDLRRVHWPSSARGDDLVVRRDEQPRRPGCIIVLDTRSATMTPAVFERCVSAAASIAVAAARAGQPVRLVTTAGFDSGPDRGEHHLDLILRALAGVTPEPAVTVPPLRRDEPVILVTSGGGPRDTPVLTSLPTVALRVAIADRADDAAHAPDTVTVSPGQSFGDAWEHHLGSARRLRGRAGTVAR